MKKTFFLLILPLLVLEATPCNNTQKDKAAYFSDKAAKQIVSDNYNGGNNIYAVVSECDYNTFSDKFTLNIEIHWSGELIVSNKYECDGILKMDGDGDNPKFIVKWQNEKLEEYLSNINMLRIGAGVVFFLDSLDKQHR